MITFAASFNTLVMETLINRNKRLIAHTNTDVVRSIMNDINWNSRLISIRGARGTGKTTLMLQYLKINGIDYRQKLYVSLDSGYFTQHSLLDFAEKFYIQGGKQLFLDEVHKYPTWSKEVKEIYDSFPDMKLVLSGSSVLNILNADADLSRRCVPYEMQGLSFREFLWMVKGIRIEKVKLEELLAHGGDFCDMVNTKCRPLQFFNEYLESGYYPFVLEGEREYQLRLQEVIDFILEVELPMCCGVEIGNVRKIKSLLTILATNVPLQIDISKMAVSIGTSRLTVLSYLQALRRARLINLLYSDESSVKKMQKPDKIYLENTNISHILSLNLPNIGNLREAFLVNQLSYKHTVEYSKKGDFLIDGIYTVEVGGKSKEAKQIADIENSYIAADNIEYVVGNKIPLWAFGFLY